MPQEIFSKFQTLLSLNLDNQIRQQKKISNQNRQMDAIPSATNSYLTGGLFVPQKALSVEHKAPENKPKGILGSLSKSALLYNNRKDRS